PVNIPEFAGAGVQDGAVALRNGLLKWLGVTGDNSLWGAGVKIAILDTGIADHIAFRNTIQRINLVPLSADATELNGHGTSVASLIFSDNQQAPGIAPGATPLSVRIANDNGSSSSFLIAQGIMAAVDAGAQLINISLGGNGRSTLVESSLDYAQKAGAVVVAAAGNSGTAGVMQPAASPSVIAVGAVDANNQHLNFSNTGSEIAVSAPGYAVNAAYPDDLAAVVSGTSFSSPIITGTIAAAMSNSGSQTLSATQATAAMNSNLNDVDVPGNDPSTGSGVPDIWRILNGKTPGIYDAAITSVSASGNQVNVLVQNLGTETIINAGVSVNVNGFPTSANITTLAPGATRVIMVPGGGSENLNIQGTVRLSGGQTDRRPSNDSISHTTAAPGP
ncbi:MAG TPA: S8 family serine peptidase, partial [Verrucomicrobiae bacterium]|nr:S8 family serine peptidase [Verrucomicrobiae bacterium]